MRLISCSNETIIVLKGIHSLLPDLEEEIGFFKSYFPHFCFHVFPSSTQTMEYFFMEYSFTVFPHPSACFQSLMLQRYSPPTCKLCTRSGFKKRKLKNNINISSAKHLNALYLVRDGGTAMCLGRWERESKISQLDLNSTLSLYIH